MSTLARKLLEIGKPALSVSGTDITGSAINATSYNLGTRALGDAPLAGERRFIFVVGGVLDSTSNRSIAGISIAGAAGTLVATTSTSSAAVGLYYREVATGTTGNITVTANTGCNGAGAVVFRVISGPDGITVGTPQTSTSTGTVNFTFTTENLGLVIAGVMTRSSSSNVSSYSNMNKYSELDTNSSDKISGASVATTGTSLSAAITISSTPSAKATVGVPIYAA